MCPVAHHACWFLCWGHHAMYVYSVNIYLSIILIIYNISYRSIIVVKILTSEIMLRLIPSTYATYFKRTDCSHHGRKRSLLLHLFTEARGPLPSTILYSHLRFWGQSLFNNFGGLCEVCGHDERVPGANQPDAVENPICGRVDRHANANNDHTLQQQEHQPRPCCIGK